MKSGKIFQIFFRRDGNLKRIQGTFIVNLKKLLFQPYTKHLVLELREDYKSSKFTYDNEMAIFNRVASPDVVAFLYLNSVANLPNFCRQNSTKKPLFEKQTVSAQICLSRLTTINRIWIGSRLID